MKGASLFQDFQKALAIVGRPHYRTLAGLLLMMIIGSTLEVMGIGLVLPVMTILINPDTISEYEAVRQLGALLGNPPNSTLALVMLGCLAGAYLIKNLYRSWLMYVQARFAFNQQAEIAQRLYKGYLFKPYTFHLQRNSATLIRNITMESDLFSLLVLVPALLICAEAVVVFAIFAFLLFVNFGATLAIILIFGGCSLAFYFAVQRRLVRWGAARQQHDMERIKHAQQGLGGIKDIKFLGREHFFYELFAEHSTGRSKYEGRSFFLSQLPIVWLETVAIITVVALFSAIIIQGTSFEQIIPTLALFAAAALRAMPSLGKMINSGQQLRYSNSVIETLHTELVEVGDQEIETMESVGTLADFQRLQISKLSFCYPGADSNALSDVTFDVLRGQSIGIVGTSGSGKTTLIDLILGLLPPVSGDIKADTQSIYDDVRAWQRKVGYVPQSIYLADQTLRKNVAFGLPDEEIDDDAVAKAIHMAQLESLIESLPEGLETEVGERGVRLSGGQRQRVGIARALYHDPDLLVLDEATAALDTETEQAVMEAVSALSGQKTLIMIAHRLTTVSECDVVHRFEKGRIIESTLGGKSATQTPVTAHTGESPTLAK
jgi:ABC-type multidrug transport system fused ATPase/permease subunit